MSLSKEDEFEIQERIKDLSFAAREAWFTLSNLSAEKRNEILTLVIKKLEQEKSLIFAANQTDLEQGKKDGLSEALLDRLALNEKRFQGILESLKQVISLPDPLGILLENTTRPNGLQIKKITVPIGVIGVIYESRPNVTVEAAALSIKSGNAVILKGGKEAFHSNTVLANCFIEVLNELKLPQGFVTLVPFKERLATLELLKQRDKIDLIIPRGGSGLIDFVLENSRIPVIKHDKGLCHVFIDEEADFKKAIAISLNAKVSRPSVCNAMETLLIHDDISQALLPELIGAFRKEGVLLKGCDKCRAIDSSLEIATEEDWSTEYLDKILSIKIVDNLQKAIAHIERYGSRHSDAIVTENKKTAAKFIQQVDSAAVFINASTRFNDGFEFGLGAEIGISTEKLHARGPMGLREMTTYKYIVLGTGHVRV
jgi:glutamate-5-semialdehyde dehydrogenase